MRQATCCVGCGTKAPNIVQDSDEDGHWYWVCALCFKAARPGAPVQEDLPKRKELVQAFDGLVSEFDSGGDHDYASAVLGVRDAILHAFGWKAPGE